MGGHQQTPNYWINEGDGTPLNDMSSIFLPDKLERIHDPNYPYRDGYSNRDSFTNRDAYTNRDGFTNRDSSLYPNRDNRDGLPTKDNLPNIYIPKDYLVYR